VKQSVGSIGPADKAGAGAWRGPAGRAGRPAAGRGRARSMVLIPGLDRLDGSVIASMPDDLWSSHTAEIQQALAQAQKTEPHLAFSTFCRRYQDGTDLTTAAMRTHMMAEEGVPPADAAAATGVVVVAAAAAAAPPPPPPPPPAATSDARTPPLRAAAMATSISEVRLAPPPAGTVRDSSAPQLTGFAESAAEARVYQDAVLDINIEAWYPLLQDFTFVTEFVPLTPAAGQLFVDSYNAYETHKKRVLLQELPSDAQYTPPADIQRRTDELAVELQEAIDRVRCSASEPVFIKASSRSAKDAPTSRSRLGTIFSELLRAHPEPERSSDNTKLVCMLQAGLELLKVHSAGDALDLFLRSERIYQDMLLALERPDRWCENFGAQGKRCERSHSRGCATATPFFLLLLRLLSFFLSFCLSVFLSFDARSNLR
jgi:hypothetical protein